MKEHFHLFPVLPRRAMRWAGFAKAVAACAVTAGALHVPEAAAAGGNQSCSSSSMRAETSWNVMNNFAGIANGVSIADITFSQTTTALNTLINYAVEAVVLMPAGSLGPYQTIPLSTFPGLGLRWSWAGYEDLGGAAVNTSMLRPVGTVVTSSAIFTNATFTSTPTTKTFKLKWKFELVVTDVRAYAGGVGDFSRESNLGSMSVLPSINDITAPIKKQACSPVLSGFQQALGKGGVIALPELPKPPTPTCQFPISTLNQTVTLNDSSTGSVPANGAARTEGAASETRFNINAVNCGANSNYAIYFTDTSAAGASKDYLNSTSGGALSGKVNLRLYQGSNSVPVQFGPAPTGSSLPANPPGVTNSGTQAGSSFVHDFYAQYVRAPGVTGTLPAGTMGAQTTVTVVYP
ncbi:fimbrial protein [Comamonas sp. C24C]